MAAAGAKASIEAQKTEPAKKTDSAAKTPAKKTKKRQSSAKKKQSPTGKRTKTGGNKGKSEKSDEEKRKKLIQNEVRRLTATFKTIESEKRRLVKATIEDAAFLTVSMQELRDQIAREGMQVEYKNGENQYGTKQSPAVLSYLAMSQKLSTAMKILLECQPKTEKKEIDDKFDDFIVERGDD
jgi:hypothetical protein